MPCMAHGPAWTSMLCVAILCQAGKAFRNHKYNPEAQPKSRESILPRHLQVLSACRTETNFGMFFVSKAPVQLLVATSRGSVCPTARCRASLGASPGRCKVLRRGAPSGGRGRCRLGRSSVDFGEPWCPMLRKSASGPDFGRILVGKHQNRPSGRQKVGRMADFEVFTIRIRPKSGPKARFPAQKHYCVT